MSDSLGGLGSATTSAGGAVALAFRIGAALVARLR